MTEPLPPDPMSEESDVGWGDVDDRGTGWGDDADRDVDIDEDAGAAEWGTDDDRPPHYDTP